MVYCHLLLASLLIGGICQLGFAQPSPTTRLGSTTSVLGPSDTEFQLTCSSSTIFSLSNVEVTFYLGSRLLYNSKTNFIIPGVVPQGINAIKITSKLADFRSGFADLRCSIQGSGSSDRVTLPYLGAKPVHFVTDPATYVVGQKFKATCVLQLAPPSVSYNVTFSYWRRLPNSWKMTPLFIFMNNLKEPGMTYANLGFGSPQLTITPLSSRPGNSFSVQMDPVDPIAADGRYGCELSLHSINTDLTFSEYNTYTTTTTTTTGGSLGVSISSLVLLSLVTLSVLAVSNAY